MNGKEIDRMDILEVYVLITMVVTIKKTIDNNDK